MKQTEAVRETGTLNGAWKAVGLALAACFLYFISSGIRNNFGVMLSGIIQNTGIAFASVSFILAVGQLCFGITQPMFGVLADRKGSRSALFLGILCAAAGVAFLPFCKTKLTLMLTLGVLLPGGLGALSFGILMGAISDRIPEKYSAAVSGIVNASSGVGNTVLTPVISMTIAAGGLRYGMKVLLVPTLLMLPVMLLMCGGGQKKSMEIPGRREETGIGKMFRIALKNRDYIFIMAGFFTCGFHMAIITNHLPTQILSYGYNDAETAFAFSVYGIATILGCLASGALCGRFRGKNVLGTLYSSRAVMVLLFFALPKSLPVICGFIFLLGFTGSATLTPVLGICRIMFGTKGAAVFFSLAFFVHQIGGFCAAWLAGECFAVLGSYTVIWTADILLAGIAGMISYMILEKAAV